MADEIQIEILEDGTVKFTTDKISGVNHVSADELLAEIDKLLGGKVIRSKRPEKHHHQHNHQHH